MKIATTAVAAALGALFALPAFAQDSADYVSRNARLEERIEQGLRSGDLTVREAARLERQTGRVEQMQSRALADGDLNRQEARRIDHAQDRLSRDIYRERHDAQFGDPNSRSAQRMADAIDRNGDQQRRIAAGMRSGDITDREAARLQRGQAHVSRTEGRAGADGHYGRYESRHVQHAENRQSRQIHHERNDRQMARGGYGDRGGYAQAGWQNQGRQWGGDRGRSMTRDPGESRRGGGYGASNGQRYARR